MISAIAQKYGVLWRRKGQVPKSDLGVGVIKEGLLKKVMPKLKLDSQGISQGRGDGREKKEERFQVELIACLTVQRWKNNWKED